MGNIQSITTKSRIEKRIKCEKNNSCSCNLQSNNAVEGMCICTVTSKDCTDTQLDILLVDNASNDGTKEWIEEQIAHTESHDTTPIYALHLSVNTGGAGGFYHGMKWAYEHGADAIWIMDDDTIPKEDALQKLWEGMACIRKQVAPKSEIGFVSSTVL